MKTSLILFIATASIPALVFVGLGATFALSSAAVVGVGAMLSLDYGNERTSYRNAFKMKVPAARAVRVELHPLAA